MLSWGLVWFAADLQCNSSLAFDKQFARMTQFGAIAIDAARRCQAKSIRQVRVAGVHRPSLYEPCFGRVDVFAAQSRGHK